MPYFPLGVFLLPGEDIPLRIFEPRYLQLIDEARDDGFTFVIPYVKQSRIEDIGCEVKLQQVVAESPKGRKVITVESVSLVRIVTFEEKMEGKLYAGGMVEEITCDNVVRDPALAELVIYYTEKYDHDFLKGSDGKALRHMDILKGLNLASDDKYSFILMDTLHKKEQFLYRQLQFLKLIRRQEQMLDEDFRLN